MLPELVSQRTKIQLEGKRVWWCGRISNPVGGVSHSRVGSTPTSFRHFICSRVFGAGNRSVVLIPSLCLDLARAWLRFDFRRLIFRCLLLHCDR